jgi:hypothetical protein
MIDLPSFETKDKEGESKVKLNKENAGSLLGFINTMG